MMNYVVDSFDKLEREVGISEAEKRFVHHGNESHHYFVVNFGSRGEMENFHHKYGVGRTSASPEDTGAPREILDEF